MNRKPRKGYSEGFLFLLRYHVEISERNFFITEDYVKGEPISEMCNKYNLRVSSIKKIVYTSKKKCSDYIKSLPNHVDCGHVVNLNIETINNANIIICICDDFFGSAIDKINKKIIQIINENKQVYEDYTAECSKIGMDRILGEDQEKIGSIFCKILYNKADESCIDFLKQNDFRVWVC